MTKPDSEKDCFDFQKGVCSRGDACRFSHSSRRAEETKESVACFDFQKGTCSYGDACRFSHSDEAQVKRMSKRKKLVDQIIVQKRALGMSAYGPGRSAGSGWSAGPGPRPEERQLLLILDLNKVLIWRAKGATVDFMVRPHALEFVHHMSTHFTLALWTSMTPRVANKIINDLFREFPIENFLFRYYQSKCTTENSKNKPMDNDPGIIITRDNFK